MKRLQPARLLGLALALLASGRGVLALAGPWLPRDGTTGGFADQVAAGCAVALVGCWAWLALGTVVVAAQSTTRAPGLAGRGPRWVPGALHVLVPAALGLAVATAPAGAAPAPGPGPASTSASAPSGPRDPATTGLPLPDRAATTHDRRRTVVVRAGDTLWAIAADLLPQAAPDAAVDVTWRRLARANTRTVPDPHLILPGTRLRVPGAAVHPSPVHPREEAP